MNTINTAAIAAINKDRQDQVVDQAQATIAYILREQETIKGCRQAIKEHQEVLNQVAEDVLTAEMVLGRPPSATPTVNEVTILKAIKDRNDSKAKSLEGKSKIHSESVDANTKTIAACEKRIAELRKQLSELAVDEITVAQVLG